MSRDRVTEEPIKRYLEWASLMIAAGEYAYARNLPCETLVLPRAKAIRDRIAELHVDCARGQYVERNLTGALMSLPIAAALRPTFAPSFMRSAWRAFQKLDFRARDS